MHNMVFNWNFFRLSNTLSFNLYDSLMPLFYSTADKKLCLPSDICTQYSFYLICIWYMYMCVRVVADLTTWDTESEVDTHSKNNVMFSVVIISQTLDKRLLPLVLIIWICFQSSHMGSKWRKKLLHFTRCFIYIMQALIPIFSHD